MTSLAISYLKGVVMPNYVYISMQAHCDDVAEMQRFKQVLNAKDNDFDFNGIIPMPIDLDVIHGSSGSVAKELLLLDKDALLKDTHLRRFVDLYDEVENEITVKDFIELVRYTNENSCDSALNVINIELGEKYIENEQKYGFSTWYEWRLEHWGVKWNASNVEYTDMQDDFFAVCFMTAWSFPLDIFNVITKQFPSITVDVEFCEESKDFAGVYHSSNGEREVEFFDDYNEIERLYKELICDDDELDDE